VRASDRAYRALLEDIVEWRLTPGTVLGEVDQAARLGVSRTPLREALSRLVADGLVSPLPGRGLVVTEVSLHDITELFELRRVLEGPAARLAAARRDPGGFEGLQRDFRAAPDLLRRDDVVQHEYFALVARLDDAIDTACGNPYLVASLRGLRIHFVRIRRHAASDTQRLLEAANEHLLIVDAIVAGDAELAEHATHVHLHRALCSVLAHTQPVLDGTTQPQRDSA
jgi:DNA-binding GntR family transcriptional regulator